MMRSEKLISELIVAIQVLTLLPMIALAVFV